MQKQLILSLFLALSSVHAPAFAEMPTCPDAVQEQTVPCKPTATTQILPVCTDAIEEQTEACKPTPTTQIKTEIRCIDDDGKAWTKDEVARGKGNFAKHGNDKCWGEGESHGYSHNESHGQSTGHSISGQMPQNANVGESHGYSQGEGHSEGWSEGESVSSGEGCSCSCNENEGETHTSGSGTENG